METKAETNGGAAVSSSDIVSRIIGYHEMEAYSYRKRIDELKRDIIWLQEKADEHSIMAQTLRHLAANARTERPAPTADARKH